MGANLLQSASVYIHFLKIPKENYRLNKLYNHSIIMRNKSDISTLLFIN